MPNFSTTDLILGLLSLALLGAIGCTGDLLSTDTLPPTPPPGTSLASPDAGHLMPKADALHPPTTAAPDMPQAPDLEPPLAATGAPRVWRLSNAQYARSVDALLGSGGEASAASFLGEVGGHGFANSADRNPIGDQRALEYQRAAQELAQGVVEDPDRLRTLWPCAPKTTGFDDEACVTQFVGTFVSQAFRRPLLQEEAADYQAFFEQVRDEIDGKTAIQMVIETVLQSPSFLYRTEVGPLNAPPPVDGQLIGLTPHERASLLSYVLWGAPPDRHLSASAKDLDTEQGRREHVAQMLDDPRLLQGFETFIFGLLELEALEHASPPEGFEQEWDRLRQSMRQEPRHFLEYVLFSGKVSPNFGELWRAPYNFADERLASIYGVDGPRGQGFAKVDTAGVRPGLLGQAGVIASHSLPDGTSPPRRGKLIAQRFACQSVPPPPDNIPIPDEIATAPLTTRAYFEAVTGPGTCGAGCHVFLNPPGFAFEHFDQVGRWRSKEGTMAIDSAVDLSALGFGQVQGAADLGHQIATSDHALDCFGREFYRYVMGRLDTQQEQPMIAKVSDVFRHAGGDLRVLLLELLTRDPLYQREYRH